jgi:hypothetical protein
MIIFFLLQWPTAFALKNVPWIFLYDLPFHSIPPTANFVSFPSVVYIFGTYMGSVSVVTTVKWFWFFVGAARSHTSHFTLECRAVLTCFHVQSLSRSAFQVTIMKSSKSLIPPRIFNCAIEE